jgi:hypothetical protein
VNPWDVATWACSIALAVSGVLIFGFFLKDARGILKKEGRSSEEKKPELDTTDGTG